MRGLTVCFLLLAAGAAPLAGQDGRDTLRGSRELRTRIEQRFAERVKEELRLTDDQAARLKAVATEQGDRRRALRHREWALRSALAGQIRDGAQSDPDSVARLTRDLLDLRVAYAESWREEMGRLTFLTPVQRAQLLVMRERLLQRAHEMRGERRGFRHRGDAH
jgi:hypothetical protein